MKDKVKASTKPSAPVSRRDTTKLPRSVKQPEMQQKGISRRRMLRMIGTALHRGLLLAARSLWEDAPANAEPKAQSRVHRLATTIGTAASRALLVLFIVLVTGLRINIQPVQYGKSPVSASNLSVQAVPPQPVDQCDLRDTIGNATTFEASTWNQVRSWCGYIIPNAIANELDPYLIAAVMWIESHGNPQSYSASGAVGLMQVMPSDGIATRFANALNQPYFSDRPTMEQLFDPAFNIYYGAALLAQNIARTGSVRDGLVAYGPENMGYSYADTVLTLYQRLRS